MQDNHNDTCTLVETLLACGEQDTETVREHLKTCAHCQLFATKMRSLDDAMQKTFSAPPASPAFTEQVMSRVMNQIDTGRDEDHKDSADWLSKGMLSFGILMGLYHIARFFLGLLLASMAAAG